ncbi:tape measure protein [Phocaeicola coprocola]|uniref:tape measure protein n=1 Tax=Phocaeicola coprocola TaxID=310298 RepID=UPI00266EFD3D|nr:tape measure protein [Phocaeicola coprocola]
MATLVFRVSAQYDEVIRLRNEISKLEAQLKKMDVNKSPAAAKALETQLASARQQMMGLVTEAAKAGAVMEKDFKSNIYNASQSVNDFTQKIIDQKRVVKDVEHDVKRLGDSYKTALKRNPTGAASLLSEYQSAKKTLDEEKATLFGLTQQQAEARLSVKRLKDEYAAFKEEAGETVEANDKMSVSLTKVLGVIGGVTALKNFVTELVNVRGQFQQLEIAFSTMLKSKEKADKLMSELVDIAAKTPFDLQGVASSAKQMIAYGSSAENVGDELVMLGNVAAGVGSQLSEIAYLYGTLRTQGRAYATDIRQFAGRGIPIYEELAKVLGVTKDEVSGLVTAGKVGFKEVEQAFKNMTSESGIYYNLMQEQSKSLTGQLSNLGDAWDTMLNEIGKDTQGIASSGISAVKGLIENYETVGKVLLGLIATYGTYKTALIVTRITQDALTARMELAILVTKAQTVAQKALNLTMSVNPYAAIATVVVVTSAALLNYASNLDKCKKGIDAYNKSVEEAARKEAEHKEEIEKLLSVAQDEQSSTEDRKEALIRLEQKYPDIFKKYKTEADMLRDILNIKKQINEEDERRRNVSDQEELNRLNTEINKLNEAIKSASQSGAGLSIQSLVNEKNNLIKQRDLKQEEVNKKRHDEILSDLSGYSNEQLQKEVDVRERLMKRLENAQKLGNSVKNGKILNGILPGVKTIEQLQAEKQTIERELNNRGKTNDETKNKKYWEDKKKEAEAARDVLDVSEKNSEEWNRYTQQIQEAQAQIEKYSNSNTILKYAERQKKEQEQIAEELLQLRFKNQQDEINLMEDGAEKKRKQIELDYQKEYTEIQKLEREWLAKNGEKLTQEQSIEISRRYTNAESKYDKGISELEGGFTPEQLKTSMNEYLAAYGTYINKRNAIIALSEEKKKGKNEWEKKSIDEETKRTLSNLDIEAAKTTSSISLLFGDMKDKTLKDLQDINEKGKAALEFLKSGEWNEEKGLELGITKETFEVWSQSPEKLKNISDALRDNKKAADDLRPSYDKVADGLKKIFMSGDDTKKLKESLFDIQEGMNEIMQVGSFLSDTFSSLGDAFGNDTFTDIADGINVAMDAANSAMQGAQAGSAFGPWGAAAGAAIGLVSSLASSIAKIHDKKNEKRIQELQDQIEVLEKSYERLGNSIEKAYSKDASNLINQQNKLLEQQKVLIQQQIREEQDKKKTDNDRIKEWQQQIEEINNLIEENKEKAVDAIFGEDVKTAIEDFASAYAEAWSNGEDRAESAKDAVKNIMRQMVTESIKSAIQASGSMEKIRQKLQEFYADNVLSGWEQNYIYNMAEELQKELDKQFGWADSLMKDDSKEQQSASGRGFGTEMTHEDAGELSGRFTAVYESNLRIETATQQQTIAITELRGSISSLITQAQGMYNIADETRTILANSYLELQQIRENTGEIIKPIKQIQKDIEEVKRNTSRL